MIKMIDIDLQILVDNSNIPSKKLFDHWVEMVFKTSQIKKPIEVSLCVVPIKQIQFLNKQFRNKDKPTNVLSFPTKMPDGHGVEYLGDVVLCADIIEQEAFAQTKPLESHWAHMTVHSILHLLGYDHEKPAEAEVMEDLEIEILHNLGYANPYEDHTND